LSVDKSSYTPSSTIIVTLVNRGATNVITFDHQTGCTILTLQRQVSGDWQPVGSCAMGRVTQQVTIPAGKTMQIKLTPGGGQIHPSLWPTGTCRVVLRFASSQQGAATVVATMLFTIR
jgi:hypothetical protein